MNTNYWIDIIKAELRRAESAYPDWPPDVVHQVAIMAEEAGEAVQAANDVAHKGALLEPLRRELVQTAAMCLRCLNALDIVGLNT